MEQNDTEETSDEERDGDGNVSIWWTAVALFTLRGTLLQMFRGKAGKGWRRIGQKDVSDWRFGGLLPGLRLDFDELHTSDVFGSRTAIS